MPTTRRIQFDQVENSAISAGAAEIKREFKLPLAFPSEVEAAATKAAANPRIPTLDRTDIALITLDPPESMDLDQAMFVERIGSGYKVYYAIADVAAFVSAGDPIDIEAHRRGETLYGASDRIPLHPTVLSENAASLLPDLIRPALLWAIELDATGERTSVDVRRAQVKSRAKLNYAGVQASIDAGSADPMWAILREIGEKRAQREQRLGGINLRLPEQEVSCVDGQWIVAFHPRYAVEDWNEQISLLTGMAAASLMVSAKVGVLRTLPKPDPAAIQRLRLTASALAIDWPAAQTYPEFIRALDPAKSSHVAMMVACTTVLRGAGYAAFNGSVPEQPMHWALAAEYAHATAPLRRLVDRYVGEVCVALCANQPVPAWALAALPGLPATMQAADHRASRFQHAIVDLTEAVTLAPRIGEIFDGAIVELAPNHPDQGVVMVRDPAIEAQINADAALLLGASVKVKLVTADPATRSTRFELVT